MDLKTAQGAIDEILKHSTDVYARHGVNGYFHCTYEYNPLGFSCDAALLHNDCVLVMANYILDKSHGLEISEKEAKRIETSVKSLLFNLISYHGIHNLMNNRYNRKKYFIYRITESADRERDEIGN